MGRRLPRLRVVLRLGAGIAAVIGLAIAPGIARAEREGATAPVKAAAPAKASAPAKAGASAPAKAGAGAPAKAGAGAPAKAGAGASAAAKKDDDGDKKDDDAKKDDDRDERDDDAKKDDDASPEAKPEKPSAKGQPAAKAPKGPLPLITPRAEPSRAARRAVAGGPTNDEATMGAETPELKELRAAERELFAPTMPTLGSPWPAEVADHGTITGAPVRPRSVFPMEPPPSRPPASDGGVDLAWLADLKMPDLPVRWDDRLVKYLRFFKEDKRGRGIITLWMKRSGRYADPIRAVLRRKGLPEDLLYLAMIESGFKPTIRSPAGAVGLWQFMPETGRIYGLGVDRWADQRMNHVPSTEAAADFLADLYRRFRSWDMAMAAYNMGYGGLMSVARRYNTNDYWALAKLEGSLPWETTLYVPKILAAAIIGRNLAAFGLEGIAREAAIDFSELRVPPATPLSKVARACGKGTSQKDLEELNPELRAGRTPPQGEYAIKVPRASLAQCDKALAGSKRVTPAHDEHVVKAGQTLEQIAHERGTTVERLVELNGIRRGEHVGGGTVLIVPRGALASHASSAKTPAEKLAVVVPQQLYVYPDRARVFYRVQAGDTLAEVADALSVTVDELRRWNEIDPSARMIEGMTLQAFVPREKDLSRVSVLTERDVRLVPVGTEEFFDLNNDKHLTRVVVQAKGGDTLASLGKKHGVSASLMERVNRRGRNDALPAGERVVLWLSPKTPKPPAGKAAHAPDAPSHEPEPAAAPAPLPVLAAPAPEALPALPTP